MGFFNYSEVCSQYYKVLATDLFRSIHLKSLKLNLFQEVKNLLTGFFAAPVCPTGTPPPPVPGKTKSNNNKNTNTY